MSDPDAMPDPIDKAYVEAEAVLSDEAARTARRARVLAAVAGQGAPDASAPARRPPLWRRGGWLVAASVSGLAFVIASQLYRPPPPPPRSKPAAAQATPAAAANRLAAAPASPAPAEVAAPPTAATTPRPAKSEPVAPPEAFDRGAADSASAAGGVEAQSAPPRLALRGAPEPAPAPPPPAEAAGVNQPESLVGGVDNRAAGKTPDITITAEKRESRRASVPVGIGAFTSQRQDALAAERRDEKPASGLGAPDAATPGAQLRAAAAAGRTADLEALLDQGAAVDAADAQGNTALIKSVQADQPAAAAFLRRRGASLDHKNHAGQSARDIATAKGDADLNQALGLGP